ncbi:alpha-amylase family glycosyl hydrolase [Streptosporangium lutulentum]
MVWPLPPRRARSTFLTGAVLAATLIAAPLAAPLPTPALAASASPPTALSTSALTASGLSASGLSGVAGAVRRPSAEPVVSALSRTAEPSDRDLARDALRDDLTRERFYFAMTDRFANGDTGNDRGGLRGDRLTTGFDPTHKGFYQGGDLKGLLGKLDYIKNLGSTALWITPAFKNRPVQGTGADVSASYHGYWITDFTRIDPHLGTNDQMKQLVREAHKRGMKVFFDIITNHTADVIDYSEKTYSYRSKGAYPYVDADGVPFDDRRYAGTGDFPTVNTGSFPYTPVAPKGVKTPSWLNDPTMYHNRGDSTFSGGENDEYGDFFGLDDLWTERPEVVDGMIDIYRTWVREAGLDGFRIDTAKHVNMEFWEKFSPALHGYAAQKGNKRFFMFGEVYSGDPALTSRYSTRGGMDATLDFPFQEAARSFSGGTAGAARLAQLFTGDDYHTDADGNAASLPTFLGNHDMGRIGRFLQQDVQGGAPATRDGRGTAAQGPARPRVDVSHPRPAGRLLRRRTGLHRKGRRPGRPRVHVRLHDRELPERRPDRHRGHPRPGQLRPDSPALPEHLRPGQAPRRPSGPGRRRPDRAPRLRRRLRLLQDRRQGAGRVRRRRQQRRAGGHGERADLLGERPLHQGVRRGRRQGHDGRRREAGADGPGPVRGGLPGAARLAAPQAAPAVSIALPGAEVRGTPGTAGSRSPRPCPAPASTR